MGLSSGCEIACNFKIFEKVGILLLYEIFLLNLFARSSVAIAVIINGNDGRLPSRSANGAKPFYNF